MKDEGRVDVAARRHGLFAFLRRKQWWSFEGVDAARTTHFVFLAMQAFPSDYVSATVTDLASGRRHAVDRMGRVRASAGDALDVMLGSSAPALHFTGRAELGWRADLSLPGLEAHVEQRPRAPAHRDRLLTRRLDYNLLQFASNECRGTLRVDGRELALDGDGYFEHAWGVQPRQSTAHWLHFWGRDVAGVVMDCRYDEGVPHAFTWLWRPAGDACLAAPAAFTFDPGSPDAAWRIRSPDLELECRPLHSHRSRMRIPPVLPWIDIDYHEQLVAVRGTVRLRGETVAIDGFGKYDHNFNFW